MQSYKSLYGIFVVTLSKENENDFIVFNTLDTFKSRFDRILVWIFETINER